MSADTKGLADRLEFAARLLDRKPSEVYGLAGTCREAASALRAYAASRGTGVGVKGLEWTASKAQTGVGVAYWVAPWSGSWSCMTDDGREIVSRSVHPTEDEAKAAAQSDYERRIRSALLPPAAETGVVVCDVLTMQHSSGFPDHFTRVTMGDRSLTFFMSKIKGRCEYHAAELNWLFNGGAKPYILDFDDTPPAGLAEYQAKCAALAPHDGVVEALKELRGHAADVAAAGMLMGADHSETHARVQTKGRAMLKIIDAALSERKG